MSNKLNDGTYTVIDGGMLNFKSGYQVGTHQGTYAEVKTEAELEVIVQELKDAGHEVYGLWGERGVIEVDPSTHVQDLQEALALGRANGQAAIWCWASMTSIPCK